ncbi:MAG: Pullulanase [Ignavibacteriaceae bacterium]|nr:Pullulanase [Ignavibacteriaceae bacterium]
MLRILNDLNIRRSKQQRPIKHHREMLKTTKITITIFAAVLIMLHFKVKAQKTDERLNAYSDKKLGAFVEQGNTFFRLFAPRAKSVTLKVFEKVDDNTGTGHNMTKDENGVWETSLPGEKYGLFYGYVVINPEDDSVKKSQVLILDPYAKSVATFNTYMNPRKGIVVKEGDFDWGKHSENKWIQRDWRDLIIYEMHLRDQTADPSSGVQHPGTYLGLTEKGKKGGFSYIKTLNINTVEFLPIQEFGNIEIPFKDTLAGMFNTWNNYERNHWGYMTAAFFAPEAYYAENWEKLRWNQWMGQEDKARRQFKEVVKTFHEAGIGVMMDVVYNHISEYELGSFKQIDPQYYFRLNPNGSFIAQSGCGNDFKTEAPMARRLIIESLIYWMNEYHIDGFRFDLGKLIDWKTVEEISSELRKVNPSVVIVCEPWGGGYDPAGFSKRDWGAWNDQIRNGIKGQNPVNNLGWIFGKWFGDNSPQRIKSYVNGTLDRDEKGLFKKKEHAVNYLESHDDHTFGDFIRIGLGDYKNDRVITDIDKHARLTPEQLKLNKLGALFLYTAQGITMIHAGQEFARSKVVPADIDVNDPLRGKIDHNTYDKDNAVNYINYHHAELNKELVNYYAGLGALREKYSAFRRAEYEEVKFFDLPDEFTLGYQLSHGGDNFVLIFNANREKSVEFTLPAGTYEILVNGEKAGVKPLGKVKGKATLPPSTGWVLKKK